MDAPDLSIPSLFNIQGQIAVVTGGGSGVGAMIAIGLVQNGATVYISSRKENQLKEVSEALTEMGPGSCSYFVTDLSTKAGCDALTAHIKSRESKIHILVNNSGATWAAPWDNFPEKHGWDYVFAVNVKAIFYLTAGLSPLLSKDATNLAPGRVINISSNLSLSSQADGIFLNKKGTGIYPYSTSKAAVNHLTSIQATSLASKLVTVNAILPGTFPSKMTSYAYKNNISTMMGYQPTGRVGMPQDLAGTVLYLVSPAAAHVTGAHIVLDGGGKL